MPIPNQLRSQHCAQTARRIALGAAIAAGLGTTAGAALRLDPGERQGPAAPQQIYADEVELSALERLGDGWPLRPPG